MKQEFVGTQSIQEMMEELLQSLLQAGLLRLDASDEN
jgi:hypothetical protein